MNANIVPVDRYVDHGHPEVGKVFECYKKVMNVREGGVVAS